jgi:hypothetical protein
MQRKPFVWIGAAVLAIAMYLGSRMFFDSQGRKFVQEKTGIAWPAGVSQTRLFECPGFRPHWTEAFLVLPRESLSEILSKHFTQYDPALVGSRETTPGAAGDQVRWNSGTIQRKVFYNPTEPLCFFASRERLPGRRLSLGPHVYFTTGDRTGINRFTVVVDSSNGNTWIHVTYPD